MYILNQQILRRSSTEGAEAFLFTRLINNKMRHNLLQIFIQRF